VSATPSVHRPSEIYAAYARAAAAALRESGWRKRSGGVLTRQLGDGTDAWLGLNAAKRGVVQTNPVGGVRHEATMRLCDELSGGKRYVIPTLSEPLSYLSGTSAGDLFIEDLSAVEPAVDLLVDLVESCLMPFAESYRDPERQLDALERREHLVVGECAIIRRPAMLAVLGRTEEAIDVLEQELATLGDRDDPAAEQYRALGSGLRDWINAGG
jgi:hypothetical protein